MNHLRQAFAAVVVSLFTAASSPAQVVSDPVAAQLRELAAQMSQLRQELADSKKESTELRQQVEELRQQLQSMRGTPPAAGEALTAEQLTEEHELLAAKVDDQYQTKVESSSKNRVRISGLALFTTSFIGGAVNNLDVPSYAEGRNPGDSHGSLSASFRQSIFGLDIDGPQLMGAKTRGQIRADFFGAMPTVQNGATMGLIRLRTARYALDWKNTTLEIGQETPFFSPLSPSSLVSSAYPSMWNSGNLWAWTPQVNVTHRLGNPNSTRLVLQYGALDALTGEVSPEYERNPSAGERSRTPAVAMRIGGERVTAQRQMTFGTGFYYARQNWGFNRRVDSWAATADWELPLSRFVTLAGEFYRGRAIGGLGGGVGRSVLISGALTTSTVQVLPIESAGGWAQVKLKPNARWEMNLAYGGDVPFRGRSAAFPAIYGTEEYAPARNANGTANIIYQPRNNLLFSIEYRRLWTSPFEEVRHKAHQVGLGAGIIF